MLNLVFVDSELETIPHNMIDDYAVRKFAKEKRKPPQDILLDSNFLHGAIERFFPGKTNRMGRPDIFFHMLQVTQSSILNLKGGLRVYIHTKNDMVITIRPETRVPKSYNRFEGLIEDLFRKQEVGPEGNKLMTLRKMDINSLISSQFRDSEIVLLSPEAQKGPANEIFHKGSGTQDYTILIGGFSEGDFHSHLKGKFREISIFEEELTIWSVAMEMICQYERDFGVF